MGTRDWLLAWTPPLPSMFPGTQGATRPKPPSVLRRSLGNTNTTSTTKDIHSPPPPYQISPDSLNSVAPAGHPGLHKRNLSVCSVSSTSNMDASVTATAQLLGLELASRTPDPAEGSVDAEKERERDEAYVREKSREELEKLLLKAEAVIRARERGLYVSFFGRDPLRRSCSLGQAFLLQYCLQNLESLLLSANNYSRLTSLYDSAMPRLSLKLRQCPKCFRQL